VRVQEPERSLRVLPKCSLHSTELIVLPRRVFAKAGYRVALIARGSSGTANKLAEELTAAGHEVRISSSRRSPAPTRAHL
jgi:hypothetical protein